MKWGGVFFVKSGKWRGGGKKVDLSLTQGALCTVSVFFYFTFYLFGGRRECVRPQRTTPAYGPGQVTVRDRIWHVSCRGAVAR